jgi:opacity protein-like surface antigen
MTDDLRPRSRHTLLVVLVALATLASARQASAEQGAIVSANVSATSIDAGVNAGMTGAFAYRFTNRVGLGLEVMWVPVLTPKAPEVPTLPASTISPAIYPPVPIVPRITFAPEGGHAVVVSTNVRFEIPTRSRFVPYVMAGGGVGTVKEDYTVKTSFPDVVIQSIAGLDALGLATPIVNVLQASSQPLSRTFTAVALNVGGGVSINLDRRWAADVDLRYLSLLGSRTTHIGRYGGGISYRF